MTKTEKYRVICLACEAIGLKKPEFDSNWRWDQVEERKIVDLFTWNPVLERINGKAISNPFYGCKSLAEIGLKAEMLGPIKDGAHDLGVYIV